MGIEFDIETDPSQALWESIAALAPVNPFMTPEYVMARQQMGAEAWALVCRRDGEVVCGCPAFLQGQRVRQLEVPSTPLFPRKNCWDELLAFCRRRGIREVYLESFGAEAMGIPPIKGEIRRDRRREYWLDLVDTDLLAHMRKKHRYEVRRGERGGLTIRRSHQREQCRQHVEAVAASMLRQKQHGENVTVATSDESFWAFVSNGAGEIFQALRDGKVMASLLVLTAEQGAYIQSSGTNLEGQSASASHFLWYQSARAMQEEAKTVINFGGIRGSIPGLEHFKLGFGTRPVDLETVPLFLGRRARRTTIAVLRRLRRAFRR